MRIDTNNGRYIEIVTNKHGGVDVFTHNSYGAIESAKRIPTGDLVMLFNYWVNCKNGSEKSDYIK